MKHVKIACVLLLAIGVTSAASAATLRIESKLNEAVTVNVDGNYGCNTDGGTTCSIPVVEGMHALKASTASGKTFSKDARVSAERYTWTIS